jgi:cytochrome c oxidase subunit 2
MKVELYEKIWMYIAVVLLAAFASAVLFGAYAGGLHPPSNVETIDPKMVASDPRFANPGVTTNPDGSVEVAIVAQMWAYNPGAITVPAGRPVTFRLTSTDVIHGFELPGTNVNTMIVPGYVSRLHTRFDHPGDYLIVCNEFCGLGHHIMAGKLTVTEAKR